MHSCSGHTCFKPRRRTPVCHRQCTLVLATVALHKGGVHQWCHRQCTLVLATHALNQGGVHQCVIDNNTCSSHTCFTPRWRTSVCYTQCTLVQATVALHQGGVHQWCHKQCTLVLATIALHQGGVHQWCHRHYSYSSHSCI